MRFRFKPVQCSSPWPHKAHKHLVVRRGFWVKRRCLGVEDWFRTAEERVHNAFAGQPIWVPEGHRVIQVWPNIHGEDGEEASANIAKFFGSSAHFVIDEDGTTYQNLPLEQWPRNNRETGYCDPGSLET